MLCCALDATTRILLGFLDAQEMLDLEEAKKRLTTFIESRMSLLAPNLSVKARPEAVQTPAPNAMNAPTLAPCRAASAGPAPTDVAGPHAACGAAGGVACGQPRDRHRRKRA